MWMVDGLNVFEGPSISQSVHVATFEDKKDAKKATTAVNSHAALLETVKVLSEALEKIDDICSGAPGPLGDIARAALARVRELTETDKRVATLLHGLENVARHGSYEDD